MMAINYVVVVIGLALMHAVIPSSQAAIEVTNEQIREGLLSLVHSYSQLENKLDRHEQRERALGEIIKRGLQTLQKGQKIFEPMRGTFSRLDERISQIETVLLSQDEKFNEQQTKLNKAVESIEKWLASQDGTLSVGTDPEKLTEISNQIEDLSVNVKGLRKEVDAITSKHQQSTKDVETNIFKKLDSAAETLAQIQESIGGSKPTDVSKELQLLKSNLRSRSFVDDGDASSVDKDFFIALNNQTLSAIESFRQESDKNLKQAATSVSELVQGKSSCDGIATSIAEVKKDVSELHKLEQMLAQMGDNVLSVKRGMEFNVHAITLEVTDVIKESSKQLNDTINDQFEAINQTISLNHKGALSNLTSKIETEISQVWRQIGIMYNEVSSSKGALDKLQNTTESYINGTAQTMDSMEGKVGQITGRMAEVDSNLNYLLGRLSLVTQEFNQIKVGLGTALDNIRNSFQIVQNRIEVVGPGPHKIESEENEPEPDFKLLPQRDAPAAT